MFQLLCTPLRVPGLLLKVQLLSQRVLQVLQRAEQSPVTDLPPPTNIHFIMENREVQVVVGPLEPIGIQSWDA